MIGIVVVTHSSLAAELITAAEMIVGPAELLKSVSIDRSMAPDAVQQQVRDLLDEVGKDGDGVIILTDMFGGTPTNVCVEFMQDRQVEILTGVNLPMLLKSISARHEQSLPELAALLQDYGRKVVMRLADML